ncbi:MAG: rhomboid family intramembrane serine protease [Melioribacteraceae bacterium]|nr:rhomboid family intramembrane serine protease [Melioribacteraceae bacterium]
MGLDSRDYYRPSGFGGFTLFPPMIKNLLIINIAVFFIQQIFENITFSGVPGWYILNHYLALNPISGVDSFGNEFNFQIWQLFTYQFMHGDFVHILFNMFMLWMFGMEIENIMGSKKFLFFYLLCGVGAGITQILLSPVLAESLAYTIGASGAVYGVMIAFAMFFPDRYIMFYFFIPVKAKYLITFLVIIEFFSVREATFVAHLAHIGGALTALIYILSTRRYEFNTKSFFNSFKKNNFGSSFSKRKRNEIDIEDAKFYDINEKQDDDIVTQEEIDRILDKISQHGYQGLTEREKRILFNASKKY